MWIYREELLRHTLWIFVDIFLQNTAYLIFVKFCPMKPIISKGTSIYTFTYWIELRKDRLYLEQQLQRVYFLIRTLFSFHPFHPPILKNLR